MQAAFPHMKERGGSIINFGSRQGIFGGLGFGIYAATKEGIRGLSRVAAREWGKHKIRVNVSAPPRMTALPEPESIRTMFNPGGWTIDAFDEPANQDYLVGSIQNRFLRMD